MPAKTDKQARFMRVVEAAKKGETDVGGDAKKASKSMSMRQIKDFQKKAFARRCRLGAAIGALLEKQAAVENIAAGDETAAEHEAEAVNQGAPPASPLKAANCMNPLKGQFGNLPDQKNPAASNCGNRGIGGE